MSSVSQTPETQCCCHADTSVFVTAVLVVCAIEQATVLFAEHVSETSLLSVLSSLHTLLSSQSSPHRTHCSPRSPLLTAHTALLAVLSSPHTLLSSQSSPHRTHCSPRSPLLTAHTALLSVLSSPHTLLPPSSTRSTHNTHKYECHTFTLFPNLFHPNLAMYLRTPATSSACPCSISSPLAHTSSCEALTRGGSC